MKRIALLWWCIVYCSIAYTQHIPVANPALKPFYHGVASGDPLQDRVILWTRITPENLLVRDVSVDWEIATDLSFSDIVNSGSLTTEAAKDWTVKVDAGGLQADKTYYYRFRAPDGTYSLTGRTKTAPEVTKPNLRFAVVSCSSIFSGYFNAYKRIAERADLDAVIHLGDYIYDFVDWDEPVRVRPSDSTLNAASLEDFRALHAYYNLDPDMRAVHQQHPFLLMWDNHDLAWNSSDTALTLPKYAGAIQAFYEWTAVREPVDRTRMYRYFNYGGLADIFLSDVTYFRKKPASGGGNDDPARKLWGDEQYEWLTGQLRNSTAQWKIVTSQKQFGQWNLIGVPVGTTQGIALVSLLGGADVNEYNADRVRLLRFLRDSKINNTIFLSGDLHFSFAMDLCENPFNPTYYDKNTGSKAVGVEFQPASVTRVNLDEKVKDVLPGNVIDWLTQTSVQINPHHRYTNLVQHGYGLLDLRSDKATGEFWYCNKLIVDSVQRMDAAYEVYDKVNHWHRDKVTAPTIPLLPSAPLAPFERLETSVYQVRQLDATVEVYPNPADNAATLRITTDKEKTLTVKLLDVATGSIVKNIYSGNIVHTQSLKIDVSDIPVSTVMILITSGNEVFTKPLVIAR